MKPASIAVRIFNNNNKLDSQTYFWKYDKGKSAPMTPITLSFGLCLLLTSPRKIVWAAVITTPAPKASMYGVERATTPVLLSAVWYLNDKIRE